MKRRFRFKRPKRGWYRAKKDAKRIWNHNTRRIWRKNKKYVYRYAKKWWEGDY